jgi:hypothetical protein
MLFIPFIPNKSKLAQFLCRHPLLTISRAHAKTFLPHHGKEAWIDKHKVHNYIRCVKCGKVFTAAQTTTMYGEADT